MIEEAKRTGDKQIMKKGYLQTFVVTFKWILCRLAGGADVSAARQTARGKMRRNTPSSGPTFLSGTPGASMRAGDSLE